MAQIQSLARELPGHLKKKKKKKKKYNFLEFPGGLRIWHCHLGQCYGTGLIPGQRTSAMGVAKKERK